MGRDAQVEVRIEKRTLSDGCSYRSKVKLIDIYVVLVNGRRVDSFLERSNAEAKARRLRDSSL
jgi:hypothetical protein